MKNLKRLFLVSCLALVLAWPTLAQAGGDNITVAGEESHDMANDVLLVWVVNDDYTFYQKTIGTPIWSGDLEGFVTCTYEAWGDLITGEFHNEGTCYFVGTVLGVPVELPFESVAEGNFYAGYCSAEYVSKKFTGNGKQKTIAVLTFDFLLVEADLWEGPYEGFLGPNLLRRGLNHRR